MVGVVKKKKQSSTSWIQFDATGQGWIHDVDKYVIMNRVQIDARDLRILDPLPSYPSTILGRNKAFVLNLEVHASYHFLFFFTIALCFCCVSYFVFMILCFSISRQLSLLKRLVSFSFNVSNFFLY